MEEYKEEKYLDHLTSTQTQQEGVIEESRFSAIGRRISITDAVFGDIQEGGPNYRNVRIRFPCFHRCVSSHGGYRLAGWEQRFS